MKNLIRNIVKGFHPRNFTGVLTPNKKVNNQVMFVIALFHMALASFLWMTTSEILPSPGEIWDAFVKLTFEEALLLEMWTSMKLCLVAVVQTLVISLVICYATVLPLFRPIAFVAIKFRFLTIVGLSFVFTLATAGFDDSGYLLKTSLLTFGMTVFFVTGMMRVIKDITSNELNHARTLGMSEWKVVWEVVVLSKLDKVFDVLRSNFAISWMMLTLVEGLVRSDGGVGVMLLNQNKHLHLDSVFAIQTLILIVGIVMDYMFGYSKQLCCPYSNLTKEHKS